jgi:hypothetical protein
MSLELEEINTGAFDNDPNADNLKEGGDTINENFEKLAAVANNIGLKINLGRVFFGTEVNAALFVAKMNARTTEITEAQTPVVIYIQELAETYSPDDSLYPAKVHAAIFMAGAGKYGTGNTPVTAAMLWVLPARNLLPADIADQSTIFIEPLEVPDGQSYIDIANESLWDWSDSDTETEDGIIQYYFTFEKDGEFLFAYFIGLAGVYGDGGADGLFENSMFSISTKSGVVPEKTKLSEFENDVPFPLGTAIPFDKRDKPYPGSDCLGTGAYYFEETVVTAPNLLKTVLVKSQVATKATIVFFTVSAGAAGVLYTEDVDLVPGLNSLGFYDFNLPVAVTTAVEYYVGIKPHRNDAIKFEYTGGHVGLFTSGAITPTTGTMPFWIEVEGLNKFTLSTYPETRKTVRELDYNYNENFPVVPAHLFFRDDRPTKLYSDSMARRMKGAPKINLLSDGKMIDIGNPAVIKHTDVGTTGRLIVNKDTSLNQLLYKDIQIIKALLADKIGKTASVMYFGDSVVQGGDGLVYTSMTYLMQQVLAELSITQVPIGTLWRAEGVKNEGHGGWGYDTFTGLESKFAGVDVIIPSPTQNHWTEGVDGTIDEIKANNPFLYPASADDKINYPHMCFHFVPGNTGRNISYAQDPTLGDYVIFAPDRYFPERGITIPDICVISLGVNDWYLGGFDVEKIYTTARFLIERLAAAMPDSKVIVIPARSIPTSLQPYWYLYESVISALVLKICEEAIAIGATNIYTLSVFAQTSRTVAYESISGGVPMSGYNSTQVSDISTDVHVYNENDECTEEFLDALTTAIICLIPE